MKISVAEFISARVQESGKSQRDIAREAGFNKPNIISMIKNGATKLPLDKVGPMAHALETDPSHLLHLCLAEYQPKNWQAIEPLLNNIVSEDEVKIISAIRKSASVACVIALTNTQRSKLNDFLHSVQSDS